MTCCGVSLEWSPIDGSWEPRVFGRILAECERCGTEHEAFARYDYDDETGEFSGFEIEEVVA